MTNKRRQVVVIGGGTGSFTLLSALKAYDIDLTALVNMADNGGSTGILRDELGVLPPGDIRQCLVALSEASNELRELFTFRFPTGNLAGHSFGNIFLSAVQSMTTDFTDAVTMASDVLQIKGRVLPTTLDDCHLVLRQNNKTIVGQHAIGKTKLTHYPPDLSLTPTAHIMPEARKAIQHADLVVIAPGLLYGSLAPALLVDGMADALQKAKAPVLYVANLVNKPDQTDNFAVHDYANEIERLIGQGTLSYVLYNNEPLSSWQLKKYAAEGEFPVRIDRPTLRRASYKAIAMAGVSHARIERNPHDKLIERSLIRHDGDRVAIRLMKLLDTIVKS